ncbi:MAG: hypothetical protein ABMA13_12690 [Chthoniobacteraceae bacterium]
MIGAYDFCGHYEWTFEWLRQQGGHELVKAYWDEAIRCDSQRHATALIKAGGIEGMKKYWAHTLAEEAAGYFNTATDTVFRIDMHDCPSKGFLIQNGLVQFHDYCDHCMGWIGPLMKDAGFVVDHEHTHRGQCWWEIRAASDVSAPSAPGAMSGSHDVRLRDDWHGPLDHYERATDPDEKTSGA